MFALTNVNQADVGYNGNLITASMWNALEQAGVVFLPSAGLRYEFSVYSDPSEGHGRYWTSSYGDGDCPTHAFELRFCDDHSITPSQSYLFTARGTRCDGESVRLVQDY